MIDRQISVVIPTWNRAHYLLEAIDSVLSQGHAPLELIVVDDGSTDDTAALVARRGGGIVYHRQPNQGIAAARNAGVYRARGEFLAFLDSDDTWMPGKLARQLAALDADPSLHAVYGHAEQFASPEVEPAFWRHVRTRPGIVAAPITSAMLVRREAFDRVGPFDRRLAMGVEIDWYGRMRDLGLRTAMLPDVVYRRRLHRGNYNLAHAGEQPERLHVLKSVIDRRRQRTGTD